jgi:hypothetical protein
MHGFITGSRAFGSPRPDSDIDLKIFMPDTAMPDIEMMGSVADKFDPKWNVMAFGKLHLHVITDPTEYWAWFDATNVLRKRAAAGLPVTNREATDYIDHVRITRGDNPFR